LFCLIGFYVTPTQYKSCKSYGDVPALPVEEDLRCPSVHYFRHKWAPNQEINSKIIYFYSIINKTSENNICLYHLPYNWQLLPCAFYQLCQKNSKYDIERMYIMLRELIQIKAVCTYDMTIKCVI
jgi:hypothetical protein